MFKGQPKGLFALALANTGERFGYYTMLAIFLLYLQAKFGFSEAVAGQFYAIFLAAVYFMPLLGGFLADKAGYGKCVVAGILVMLAGYTALAVPVSGSMSLVMIVTALLLIAVGTGLFKGNLQVMVGNLYDDPRYAAKRDSAFSLFYMAINLGAMFAPSAAKALTNWKLGAAGLSYHPQIPALCHQVLDGRISTENAVYLQGLMDGMPGAADMDFAGFSRYYLDQLCVSYNLGFSVAVISLIVSIAIYFCCRGWFRHADYNSKQAAGNSAEAELSPEETRSRISALLMVFAVVIFFWMAFHQNGSSLTYFARDYTETSVSGVIRGGFNIWILALLAVSVYTLFGIFQSESKKAKLLCGGATGLLWAAALAIYAGFPESMPIQPQEFQQFNPFFVVSLTPVSMAVFSSLASRGKEPSAPRKIGLGMIVAALGYLIMVIASVRLVSPMVLQGSPSPDRVSCGYLIGTYLVLTFAELLLSPMGISFVTKVAPPKYKGLMMGGWFAATAIGNYLSSIPSALWNKVPLWANWSILMGLCLVSALVMFAMLRKLERI